MVSAKYIIMIGRLKVNSSIDIGGDSLLPQDPGSQDPGGQQNINPTQHFPLNNAR